MGVQVVDEKKVEEEAEVEADEEKNQSAGEPVDATVVDEVVEGEGEKEDVTEPEVMESEKIDKPPRNGTDANAFQRWWRRRTRGSTISAPPPEGETTQGTELV